jgi:integrase
MKQRRESPIKRVNAERKVKWEARYTDAKGKRRSAGTFTLKREAQEAIDVAYGRVEDPRTIGAYFEIWLDRYPRSEQTNKTNGQRVKAVLEVEIEGVPIRDWEFADWRRKHTQALIDHMLRVQGRAAKGASGILAVLSAMAEDAITDEQIDLNAFRGVRVRASDPRIRKAPRPIRTWTFELMHGFAAAGAMVRTSKTVHNGSVVPSKMDRWRPVYAEAMLSTFADTGMRIGEVLPLERDDLIDGVFYLKRTATPEGRILRGTKTDHDEWTAGREVPCAPRLESLIMALPVREDTPLLYPTSTGKLWRARNFYRDVWSPTQRFAKIDPRPHEMRHSFVTHLRARGINDADLADMAGHGIETMLTTYTHATRESFEAVRQVIG